MMRPELTLEARGAEVRKHDRHMETDQTHALAPGMAYSGGKVRLERGFPPGLFSSDLYFGNAASAPIMAANLASLSVCSLVFRAGVGWNGNLTLQYNVLPQETTDVSRTAPSAALQKRGRERFVSADLARRAEELRSPPAGNGPVQREKWERRTRSGWRKRRPRAAQRARSHSRDTRSRHGERRPAGRLGRTSEG